MTAWHQGERVGRRAALDALTNVLRSEWYQRGPKRTGAEVISELNRRANRR
jgi:hypothetical protein